MKGPSYLVVGGAGFIGSHLVRRLLGTGAPVRVLDNFSTGSRQNLEGVDGPLEVIEGDIRDRRAVAGALAGVTHVLHQAALPSVARSVADPQTSHDVNVVGTLNLLVAARDVGVRRFVYASSSSVYGNTTELPKHEEMQPRPLSPYAIGKHCAEQYCRVFHELYGFETVILRYFNVFGPRQDPNGPYSAAIPLFIKALLRGDRPVVKGDGRQTRDFTFVANVVEANRLACEAEGAAGKVFNVGTGRNISLLDLIAAIEKLTGSHVKPAFEAVRAGDVRDSRADITRAREILGYEPAVDLADGLAETVEHYKKHVVR